MLGKSNGKSTQHYNITKQACLDMRLFSNSNKSNKSQCNLNKCLILCQVRALEYISHNLMLFRFGVILLGYCHANLNPELNLEAYYSKIMLNIWLFVMFIVLHCNISVNTNKIALILIVFFKTIVYVCFSSPILCANDKKASPTHPQISLLTIIYINEIYILLRVKLIAIIIY